MANTVYKYALQDILRNEITWLTATIKVSLCHSYTFYQYDRYWSDALETAVPVYTATLANKTPYDGNAQANDVRFYTNFGDPVVTSMIVYQASAPGGGPDLPDNEKKLLAYIDTAINMPWTPDDRGIYIRWAPATGVFRI